jgi:hypothetical protein
MRYYNHISHGDLVATTRALRKFDQEHDGVQAPILDKILAALEADDFMTASNLFKTTVHFGAYGIGDWYPPVKFANEDPIYLQVVWGALVERWHRLMTTAAGGAR